MVGLEFFDLRGELVKFCGREGGAIGNYLPLVNIVCVPGLLLLVCGRHFEVLVGLYKLGAMRFKKFRSEEFPKRSSLGSP